MSGVSAVVVPAGAGSRFGDGKLPAPFAGKTLIEATLVGLRGVPVDEIIVVLEKEFEELQSVCEPYGVRVVENNGGDSTQIHVETDMRLSGHVAQFGRGVHKDVASKVMGQFADCLEGKL